MCMRRTFVSRSIGLSRRRPGQGMRTIIERAFTAHKPATARYVGGWRRLWPRACFARLPERRQVTCRTSSSSGNFTPVTRAGSRAFRQRGSTTAWRGSSAPRTLRRPLHRDGLVPGSRPRRAGSGMLRRVFFSSKGFRHARQGARPAPDRTLAPRTRQQHVRPDTRRHLRGCDCGRRLDKAIAALTESPNPSQSND